MDVKDSFVELERHRFRLEENMAKLRQSLQHWQTWEAEYEGLKEEILAAGDKVSSTDLVAIGRDFGGTLVDEKEIKTLLGDGKKIQRTGRQVADLVTRRLDYVQRNIQTVEKQIAAAEEKLTSLLVVRQPEVQNAEGLPLTEIREELDGDGNVISSTTTRPGDAAPQVVEVLRKAGVTDIPFRANPKAELEKVAEGSNTISRSSTKDSDRKQTSKQSAESSGTDESEGFRTNRQTRGSDMGAAAGHSENSNETPAPRDMSDSAGSMDGVNASSTKDIPIINSQASPLAKSDKLTSSDIRGISQTVEDPTAEDSPPVIPMDESPEDAALRRQMIQYGLHEVGAVVAELDLDDETESQLSYSDDDRDGDEQYTSSTDDEEEDAFGRTTRRVVDDEYRRQMLELEKKLNTREFEKSQPELRNELAGSNKMAMERTSDKPLTSVLADKSQKPTVKKGVRFAEELDISPVPAPPPRSFGASEPTLPMQDLVVERAVPSTALSGMTSSMLKKTSRFKMAREAVQKHDQASARAVHEARISNGSLSGDIQERTSIVAAASSPLIPAIGSKRADCTAPITTSSEEAVRQASDGPPGKTHLSNIIEREVSSKAVDSQDPDDMDPDLLQQEVAVEYHRMRNRMIQREGGFLPRDDQEERVPLTEEEGGSGKKMSRFKAARLRGHA